MEASIPNSLLITGIGMGLVFVLILVLWAFMAILVRLGGTDEPEDETPDVEAVAALETPPNEPTFPEASSRRRAAVAVAVAYALSTSRGRAAAGALASPQGPVSSSTWQTAQRANQLMNKQTRGYVR